MLLNLLVGYACIVACSQQPNPDSLAKYVQQKTDLYFSRAKVPGILVYYCNGNQPALYSTGYANPATKAAFNENTFFEIGSITKTFTAYIILEVLDENKITDSSFIIPYLPDSVQSNTELANIRFIQLLNHTSGLPRLPENMNLGEETLQPYENYDASKLFAYLKSAQLSAKKEYEYSNLGAALAGVLAERISKKSYSALLDQYIFLPFKMVDKNNSVEQSNNKSAGFIDDTTQAEYWNMNVMAPAGGLKCTAKEMGIYLSNMSKPLGTHNSSIVDSLTSPTHSLSATVGVARGWHFNVAKNKPVIYWHNGGTYGFSTFAAFVKETGQWVMVVVNQFNKNNIVSDRLGMQIVQKMLE